MQQPFSRSRMEKKIIHVLGNEFLKEDSLALELADTLNIKNTEFKKINTYEDLMKNHPIILDVCKGIEKTTLITDVDEFVSRRTSTVHDMDFGFFLKLNKSLGNIEDIRIIAIPQKTYKGIEEDIKHIVEKI